MLIPVFDLDGTLIDSDAALEAAFVACGVDRHEITYGHVVAEECGRLGIAVDDFLAAYDPDATAPFDGVDALVRRFDPWAICSNKDGPSARAELQRLGWAPTAAAFADAFDGAKHLGPVLDALGVDAASVAFIGDTDHDRACAVSVGCRFVLAGWNPRVEPRPGDLVARRPAEVLELLA